MRYQSLSGARRSISIRKRAAFYASELAFSCYPCRAKSSFELKALLAATSCRHAEHYRSLEDPPANFIDRRTFYVPIIPRGSPIYLNILECALHARVAVSCCKSYLERTNATNGCFGRCQMAYP